MILSWYWLLHIGQGQCVAGDLLVLLVIAGFLLLIVKMLSIAESEVLADNIENTDHVTEDNDDNDTVDSDE